jgi:hypothetical protein
MVFLAACASTGYLSIGQTIAPSKCLKVFPLTLFMLANAIDVPT